MVINRIHLGSVMFAKTLAASINTRQETAPPPGALARAGTSATNCWSTPRRVAKPTRPRVRAALRVFAASLHKAF
jgi:hypothetical protein